MKLIDRESALWKYLSTDLREMLETGELLLSHMDEGRERIGICDFSFLVFPFAKAYEGFLKKLFLDVGVIKHDEYYGDEIRMGRLLNPGYHREKGNIFNVFCEHSAERRDLVERLWETWKSGRNEVFHYFPHNFRKLNYEEAMEIVQGFVIIMSEAIENCEVVIESLIEEGELEATQS